jgi:thiol:disulfide interchange protein DsbD
VRGRDGEGGGAGGAGAGAEGPGTVRVAVDGRLAGTIRVADRVRPEAVETLGALRALGVSAGMITGDVPAVARAVGEPLGLDPILAGALPGEKADAVRALGAGVGMVGDGVNDAPALSAAEVGFAMAGGTDVARAASGVTLVRPDLRLVPAAIRLARATRAVIRRNLLWAFLFNIVGIPLAAGVLEPRFGISISPEFAAFAMAMSSVIVVLSSLTLRGARLAAAAALVAGSLVAGPGAARADDLGDNPFDVTAIALPTPGDTAGDYRIEVRFAIPPGHYLYRERASVTFPEESSISAPVFPAGVVKHDKFEDRELEIYTAPMRVVARLRAAGRDRGEIFPLLVVAEYQGCTSEFCFFPQSDTLRVAAPVKANAGVSAGVSPGTGPGGPPGGVAGNEAIAPASGGSSGGGVDIAERLASKGYFLTFLGVFFSGILLSFTPCVFPMIPITVSVIGARKTASFAQSFSLSLVYVLGLALTYAVLGVVAARTGALFGAFLQNPWVVGFVVLVLSTLALSMFGLYEIQVPPALAARLQGRAGVGHGYPGVFFMGIVAGLVASPCVGPVILGLLLFIATTGSIALGFTLLLTLGLGMGVLFLVIGTFSGALSALPRAGIWMDAVKELFGVLLLGMALYFLRPLLDPIVFALIAGFLLLALAGFGGVFEPGAAGWLGRGRRTLLLVFLAVGIALTGGALREAGFLLPKPRDGGGPGASTSTDPAGGIAWLASEAEGIAAARAAGRPVMIDFTADWCLACHELDDIVFHDARVVAAAKDYVTIRLDFTKVTPDVKALQAKYSIRGLPTILFIERDGRVREDLTVTGFVKPEDFLEKMRAVSGGRA